MKRLPLLLLASVLLGLSAFTIAPAKPACAMEQVIVGGYYDALSKTGDEYNSLAGGLTWNAATTARYQVIPTGGTLSRLSVELDGVPGTNPYMIGVYKNGALQLSVVIAAGSTTAVNTTAMNVVAGDLVCLQSSRPGGNPDNTPTARWSIMFTGTTDNESIILGNGLAATSSTRYSPVSGVFAGSSTTTENYQICPTGGTMKKLFVSLSTDPGTAPDAYDVIFRKEVGDTALKVTITADATTGSNSDNTVSLSAAESLSMAYAPLNSPSAAPAVRFGMVFSPTIDGESLILGQSSDAPTNTQDEFNYLTSTARDNAWGLTEYMQGGQAPTNDMVLKKFYVEQSGSSGAGGSGDRWDYTIRANSANTTITVQISEAATTGNDVAHTYTCSAYDDLAITAGPTSAPTARTVYWGLVCYIASTATPDISINVASDNYGAVDENSTYWTKTGSTAPGFPLDSGNCTFTLTNVGGDPVDLVIKSDNWTGGLGWTLTDGSPGSATIRLSVYTSGDNLTDNLTLANADRSLASAMVNPIYLDFKLETGTFTDGVEKKGKVTITASLT